MDKFFTFINLHPSLSSVLKVYSSSEQSKTSSIFHFLTGGTNGLFRVRRADFHPAKCSELRRRFRQHQELFLQTLLSVFAFQKNFSFFSSCRQIYFSLRPFSTFKLLWSCRNKISIHWYILLVSMPAKKSGVVRRSFSSDHRTRTNVT